MLGGRWGEKGPAHSLVSSGGGVGGRVCEEGSAEAEAEREGTSEARVEKAKTCLPSSPYTYAKFSSSCRNFSCVVLA